MHQVRISRKTVKWSVLQEKTSPFQEAIGFSSLPLHAKRDGKPMSPGFFKIRTHFRKSAPLCGNKQLSCAIKRWKAALLRHEVEIFTIFMPNLFELVQFSWSLIFISARFRHYVVRWMKSIARWPDIFNWHLKRIESDLNWLNVMTPQLKKDV